MDALDRLTQLLTEQSRIVSEMEKTAKDASQADVLVENDALRRRTERLAEELKAARNELNDTADENKRLKSQLFDHMFNERARLINNSQSRAKAYFADKLNAETDRLTQLETRLNGKCDEYLEYLKKNRIDLENYVQTNLDAFKTYAMREIDRLRKQSEEAGQSLYAYKDEELKRLHDEPLSFDDVMRRDKQNNMESFLGLKILNKLGLILIIFGVVALGQFTITRVPNEAKSALIFLLGLLMLAGGEFLNRNKTNVFSLGLSGGGSAILYLAVALSFFYLKIMNAPSALLLCVLITVASFVLSIRYNAQVIAVFALIGGYLSVVFIRRDGDMSGLVYYQLTYFIFLGMFSLLISFIKKWHAAQYTGFFFQIFAVANGLFISLPKNRVNTVVSLVFVSLMFIIYSLIPLVSTYRTKSRLNVYDNTLIALNIVFGSGMMFAVLKAYDRLEWAAFMLLALCAWHFIAGRAAEIFLSDETVCRVICYITGLAFAVLIVPVRFDFEYVSLGWLTEGAGLLISGIVLKHRGLKTAGWIISGLCLLMFLLFDFTYLPRAGFAFFIRYLSITLCSALIAASYYYAGESSAGEFRAYKTAVLVNIWIFLVYAIETRVPALIPGSVWAPQYMYLVHMLAAAVTFAWSYIVSKNKILSDSYTRNASIVISIIGILFILGLNSTAHPGAVSGFAARMAVLAIIVSIAVNLMSVLVFIDMIQRLTVNRVLTIEWYPVCAGAFILLLITQNLYVMLDLSPASLVLTILFASAALIFILYGFYKRYLYIRLAGLGLSFAVTVKLFIVDLSFLTSVTRIISYFGLGAALLLISFVYQFFDKELKKGTTPDK